MKPVERATIFMKMLNVFMVSAICAALIAWAFL